MYVCRRELDNSEAERAQHLQKIHDLQEHIQEKERQFIELQEQVPCIICLWLIVPFAFVI